MLKLLLFCLWFLFGFFPLHLTKGVIYIFKMSTFYFLYHKFFNLLLTVLWLFFFLQDLHFVFFSLNFLLPWCPVFDYLLVIFCLFSFFPPLLSPFLSSPLLLIFPFPFFWDKILPHTLDCPQPCCLPASASFFFLFLKQVFL